MIKFLSKFFFISLLLNFAWEVTQMPLFEEMGSGIRSDFNEFLKIHWNVSFRDTLMILTAYLLIGTVLRNWNWVKKFNNGWVAFWLFLPLWQGLVEYFSVYHLSRFEYAESMPLIFGIGLSPLLQMLILPTVAVLLSRHLLSDQD
ncbi:hypothetical protein GW950_00690 [Candidatus Wolfebacteria bacterium]|nr:hypothetical protein [Candidatus Wolfebacteria bacterium]